MHAVVVTQPGGPEVLAWRPVPDPAPGAGEVLVDVVATAVNRADLLQRQGFYPPPPGAPEYLGLECSGRVAALGADVTGWAVGDPVCALLAGGGYAERVAVPAGQLLPPPDGVDLVAAAALPEAAGTVWSNLFDVARLAPGETVLIHGGASGVGTLAVQVARAHGARVAVTAGSADKLDRCRELGADVTVNYRTQDFVAEVRAATDGRGADVILDIVGAKYLPQNLDALALDGRLVVIGLQGGAVGELNLGLLLAKRVAVHGTTLRSRSLADKARIVAGVRRDIWPAIETGRVRPVVHARLPITEVAAAHRLVADSGHVGKVVLVVRD